ncbi:PH and SEC7 domain-containing protein 4 [Eublepharis macularius]|uniref:PH and SEC7 domain-containing protein 4 n=1 Tax=Eublepharis macularius TaxID=481883 RepID=A0AA97LF63_EUBMA|nr:PH and SEC7 domain-containing protein 4 [Eublepharis macularius]XP_054853521.1 PH and SEC7 domain-containing protein 4 [Eublepharis macularius]
MRAGLSLVGPFLEVSMVNARMEHSGPPHSSDLMNFLANYGSGELSCETGGSLGEAQDLPVPSETFQSEVRPPPSLSYIENLDFMQESLEGARSNPETPAEKPFSALAPTCTAGPSQCMALSCEKMEQPQREDFHSENLKNQDKSSDDTTQALFWASILQAQMCVMDLQGEIDRQKEPEKIAYLSPEKVPATPVSQDLMDSHEPLHLDSESEESEGLSERLEEQEGSSEGEDEDEEVEYLFYDNPLFQENPHPTRTTSFEGQTLWGHPEGRTSVEDEEGILGSGLVSKKQDNVLFYQTSVTTSPEALDTPSLPDLTSCPIPAYMPHYRSFSPLVITEGDLESDCPTEENIEVQGCFADQQANSHPGSVSPAGANHAADSSGEGLLFSASNTSLLSVLLQEPNENHQPPSPVEIRGTPPATQVFSLPDAESSLWQEKFKPQAQSCSPLASSCARVEEPERTSCLQEEVASSDLHLVSFGGVDRKLENPAEGLEMVEVPTVHGDEILEEEEEEEKTEATPRCSEEPAGVPSQTGEMPHAKEPAEPNGFLLTNGTSGDRAAAQRLAARLYHLDGFKRSQVASFLRKNNEFSRMVTEAYLSFFQFGGLTVDKALRLFLKAFVLTGETQERERILRHFSQRYHCCNPEAFLTPDAVHTLTCAIMLLNTDLHGQNIGRSMTCQDFVANLNGMNNGSNFHKEQLKALYYSIRNEKLEWAVDEEEQSSTLIPPPTGSIRKKSNPFLTLNHDPGAKVYHQGFLTRKVHAEADGKKAPWGKRGWKTFHTVLKGMVLYFFKDENRLDTLSSEDPIGVHHALAERASKYTKRPNVFRLQTADWHIFLFQAPTPEEMNSWISRINLVAAMFSSPPFPAAVGSQRKFVRPILPTATCKNSLEDQHLAHEDWMDKISDELLEHQRNLPDKRGRSRDLEEYQLKKEYLLYEKRRYETYVRLLEVKLTSASEDLDQWEAQLQAASVADDENPSLKKSHSSPSLNADGPPTEIKVKRNISERRTVRKIIPRRNKHLL